MHSGVYFNDIQKLTKELDYLSQEILILKQELLQSKSHKANYMYIIVKPNLSL